MQTLQSIGVRAAFVLFVGLCAACSSVPATPRIVIHGVPVNEPTRIFFELENVSSSEFPALKSDEKLRSPEERVRIAYWRYAEKVAKDRGWCPRGVDMPKQVTADIGAGRRITRFNVECR